MEINNFYTATVYEKGAEVIRMMATIIGGRFRGGMDLYFERHDGQAVTSDDFVAAMEDASGVDLTDFKRWYHQAVRPRSRSRTRRSGRTPIHADAVAAHEADPRTAGENAPGDFGGGGAGDGGR